jgi:hypothetical protein
VKVLLAGEGPTELGDWHREPAWRPSPCSPGVIEALAHEAVPGDWTVAEAVAWKSIRKYRSGDHRQPETRNVLGIALLARERGYHTVLFTRDRDRQAGRERDIEAGIREANQSRDLAHVGVAGGLAVETIEAWLLAMLGERGTESLADPKPILEHRGYGTCEAKVRLVRERGLDDIPGDAAFLWLWLERVKTALVGRS